mgnify:CR=1 FL=1
MSYTDVAIMLAKETGADVDIRLISMLEKAINEGSDRNAE